jgi:putative RecB family exonuclease
MIKPIDSKHSISGKFDRIDKIEDNGLEIIDFKTGKTRNGLGQLEFYKLLAELNFDKKVSKVSYYYLNDKKIKSFDVSQVDNNKIKSKILEKINIIEKREKFSPNPSRLCSLCDFKEICPVFKHEES